MHPFLFHRFVLCTLMILVAWPLQALALEESKDQVLEALTPAIDHLLTLTDYNNRAVFDPGKITSLLDFVADAKPPEKTYTLGARNGGSSAYYEFSVDRSLKQVLDLGYNPNIPSNVTSPASIRLAYWVEIDGKRQSLPQLSDALNNLSHPVIIKGIEFIENTPDTNSGAYYSYELDRMLILMQYNGLPVLVSTSNQRDKSDVGKKGLILGPDSNWSYLYTGEKGCTKKGLGWADSYMYHSSSIMVYYQTKARDPHVKCGTFKWLKAGWAGINLVKPVHLRHGIDRFAKSFKEILESPALEDVSKVSRMFEKIDAMSNEDLRAKTRLYFHQLAERYSAANTRTRKWFSVLFKDDRYIDQMNRQEMMAIVSIEYLKYLLGKDELFDISYFESIKIPAKGSG